MAQQTEKRNSGLTTIIKGAHLRQVAREGSMGANRPSPTQNFSQNEVHSTSLGIWPINRNEFAPSTIPDGFCPTLDEGLATALHLQLFTSKYF